jgi:hypothetical protein
MERELLALVQELVDMFKYMPGLALWQARTSLAHAFTVGSRVAVVTCHGGRMVLYLSHGRGHPQMSLKFQSSLQLQVLVQALVNIL